MTKLLMRALAIMALTTTVALLSTSVTRGQEADLAAIFGQYAEAVNQGDVDGALALFTEDATWVRGGRCPPGACVGLAAVRVELEQEVTSQHRIDIIETQVTGSTLTARAEFQTVMTRAAGIERIILAYTVEFQGDKISLLRAMPDLSDPETAAFAGGMMPPQTGVGPASTADTALPLVLPLIAGLLLVGGLLTALAFGMRRTLARER